MRSEKFTPGPWHLGTMNDALFIIDEPPRPAPVDYVNTELKTRVIAKLGEPCSEGWPPEQYEANAHLIAAAPELYEALRLLYEETADYIRINKLGDTHHNCSMKRAHKALAKATTEGKPNPRED